MTENRILKVINEAGTGFMWTLCDAIQELQEKGYTENLTARHDHFEGNQGEFKLYPDDLVVDDVIRFENASDPDDQSILYAISSVRLGIKGVFVESYGIYHEDLSEEILDRIRYRVH